MQQLSFLPGEMTTGERSLILRALKTLDRHLHEPGQAMASGHPSVTGTVTRTAVRNFSRISFIPDITGSHGQ